MPRARTAEEVQGFRDELCAVATRRFAALGYEGVTIRALAAEIGCSPMTPYSYSKAKEEIFAAVRAQPSNASPTPARRRRRAPVATTSQRMSSPSPI